MQEGTVTSELRKDKLLEHTQITASVDRTNINVEKEQKTRKAQHTMCFSTVSV